MTAPTIPAAPSKPTQHGASTSGSQRDRRFMDTFRDTYKHAAFPNGRPFCGLREFQSGSSTESIAAGFLQSDLQCGEYFCDNPELGQTPQERALSLASVWNAPWLPKGGKKYMAFNYRRKLIAFDYSRVIRDEQEGMGRFWDAAAKMAGENDVIDPDRPLAIPFRIKVAMGSPVVYLNQIKLARAALAGDPWLMGAVQEPNEELAKILGFEIQYLGAMQRFGDSDYVAVQKPVESPAPLTPEQVLATSPVDLQKMIAEIVANALAASEQAKADARAAKMRAGKKPREAAA